jgi:beta-N-acetylhexosaminidase
MRTRLVSAVLRLAIAALLLQFALDWRSPVLASVRPWALAGLIGVPLVLIVAGIAALRRRNGLPAALRLLNATALTLAALALMSTLALEARFHLIRQQVLRADPDALEKLGRHLIVGYADLDEIHALIRRRAVAGVYIAARNVHAMSAAEVKRMIETMQDIRRGQHLPPLWIATDQEGGGVSRLSPPLPRPPPISEIVARHADRAARRAAIRQSAVEQGRELAGLGVNLNFAPVIDLDHGLVNPDDRLTRIHQRAISSDADVVAEAAGAYCDGLAEAGVRCTLKHFPGLGRVLEDTHRGSASLDAAPSELERTDWVPFRILMGHAAAFTMLGHVAVTALDRDHPASFSQAVVAGLLRGDWRHDGVLITDDFSMGAVYRSRDGIAGASVAAVNAGVDLILVSFDTDQYYAAMHGLLAADRDGGLRQDALRQSDRRLGDAGQPERPPDGSGPPPSR